MAEAYGADGGGTRALIGRVVLMLLATHSWGAPQLIRLDVDAASQLAISHCDEALRCTKTSTSASQRPVGRALLYDDLPWATREPAIIVVSVPPGIAVSIPGTRIAPDNDRYSLMQSSQAVGGVVVVGQFLERRIVVGGAHLDIALLDGEPPADIDVIEAWLADAAQHLMSVHGAFPAQRVQIVVVPVAGRTEFGASREAVPFGRVLRAGGPAVQFFVDQTSTLAQLKDDWTATHEFSHLLLPYVRRPDSWMSEGFASYYQNVLRARAGAYDEAMAWQKLLEGFARGRRQAYAETLTESIRTRGPNFLMRLYWSGAAIALLADVELRRRQSSLDAVLGRLNACCLPSGQSYSAQALSRKLDTLGGDGVFEALRARWANANSFPDVDSVLRDLGVVWRNDGVQFDDSAPDAALRRAIMAR